MRIHGASKDHEMLVLAVSATNLAKQGFQAQKSQMRHRKTQGKERKNRDFESFQQTFRSVGTSQDEIESGFIDQKRGHHYNV